MDGFVLRKVSIAVPTFAGQDGERYGRYPWVAFGQEEGRHADQAVFQASPRFDHVLEAHVARLNVVEGPPAVGPHLLNSLPDHSVRHIEAAEQRATEVCPAAKESDVRGFIGQERGLNVAGKGPGCGDGGRLGTGQVPGVETDYNPVFLTPDGVTGVLAMVVIIEAVGRGCFMRSIDERCAMSEQKDCTHPSWLTCLEGPGEVREGGWNLRDC